VLTYCYFKIIGSRREHEYGFEGLCGAGRDLISSDSAWKVVVRFWNLLYRPHFKGICKFSFNSLRS
jgi:hypothetical protein